MILILVAAIALMLFFFLGMISAQLIGIEKKVTTLAETAEEYAVKHYKS